MKNYRFSLLFLIFSTIFFLFSCKNKEESGYRDSTRKKDNQSDSVTKTSTIQKSNFNIYIENSGSMNGYVNKPTDFKNGLYKLIGDIHNKGLSDQLRLNFINEAICPQKPNASATDIINFIQNLNSSDFKDSKCGVTSSFLPNIINKVISTNPNEVNILISDCIFSSEKGNSKDYLSGAQQSMRTFILNELDKNDISTVIIKMKSQFFGTYFIENKSLGKKTETLTGQNRPYYIIIFGNSKSINDLLGKIDFSNYIGFDNSFSLSTTNSNKPIAKVIRKNKIGDFIIEQPANKLVINNAKVGSNKEFQFSVATNLEFLKMDDYSLRDTANYEVSPNYKLVSISRNNDITDEGLIGFTHVFILKTTDLKPNQDVFIKLKSKSPSWVDSTSTEDDSNPLNIKQQKQTFGFKYLMEGIYEAYEDKNNGKEQFFINLKVSNNK